MKSIIAKIRNAFIKNIFLKLTSLVIAAIIWIAVVNVTDPTKTDTIYNIPITIVDQDALENNQTFEPVDRLYVSVTVTGRRSVVSELKSSDFKATASLRSISDVNTLPVKVEYCGTENNPVSIIGLSLTEVEIKLENIEDKNFDIVTNVTGQVASGYEFENVELAKSYVTVSAATSTLEKIDRAVVDVDVSGAKDDFTAKYKIKLMDADGNRIKITGDSGIEVSMRNVKANITIYKVSKVSINYELTGTPADGYYIEDYGMEPSELTLVGPTGTMSKINESITITGDALDVEGITESRTTTVNLLDYIPSGVYIKGDNDGVAVLTITVSGNEDRSFNFSKNDIQIENAPEDYDVSIAANYIKVTVTGRKQYVDDITAEGLAPSIDLSDVDFSSGSATVPVNFTITDNNVSVKADVTVKVKATKKSQEDESVTETETSTDN